MSPATRTERFLYVVAREFADERTYFTGFNWPTMAAVAARRLHAPDFSAVYEAGIVHRGDYATFPTSTTHLEAYDGAVEYYGDCLDSLRSFLSSGRLDGAVVEAPTVDRFGNINTTVVGPYDSPTVRLPGPGGAKDILALSKGVTLVTGSTDENRYRDRVSYVSSPGHLDGDGSRRAAGYEPGTGPGKLLTPIASFEFGDTGRARLLATAPDASVDEVRAMTGWPLEATERELPNPDEAELAVLREVLSDARAAGYGIEDA